MRTRDEIEADLEILTWPHVVLDAAEVYDRLLRDVEPLLAALDEATRRADEAERERDEAKAELAEYIPTVSSDFFRVENGAYIEQDAVLHGGKRSTITVRRAERPSPHDLRRTAEAERDALQAEVDLYHAIPEHPDYKPTMSCCKDARQHTFHVESEARDAAVQALAQLRAEIGEPVWEYGWQTVEVGWVPEYRGENYAPLMRRRTWHGQAQYTATGDPVAVVSEGSTE